jgi:hypothetical protein
MASAVKPMWRQESEMEAMGGKQLPPEVWQRYLDGTDIATIAESLGLPVTDLQAKVDAYIDALEGDEKRAAALNMFIKLVHVYPDQETRYRVVAERLRFGDRLSILRDAIALERKRMALKYRYSGKNFWEIADLLGFWIVKGGTRVPNRAAAYKVFREALSGALMEGTDDLRKLNLGRLERLLEVVWKSAEDGNAAAIQQAVSIINTIDRYVSPVQRLDVQHSGSVALSWAEMVKSALKEAQDQSRTGEGEAEAT